GGIDGRTVYFFIQLSLQCQGSVPLATGRRGQGDLVYAPSALADVNADREAGFRPAGTGGHQFQLTQADRQGWPFLRQFPRGRLTVGPAVAMVRGVAVACSLPADLGLCVLPGGGEVGPPALPGLANVLHSLPHDIPADAVADGRTA